MEPIRASILVFAPEQFSRNFDPSLVVVAKNPIAILTQQNR